MKYPYIPSRNEFELQQQFSACRAAVALGMMLLACCGCDQKSPSEDSVAKSAPKNELIEIEPAADQRQLEKTDIKHLATASLLSACRVRDVPA